MFDETIKLILNLGRSAADLQEARQEAEKLKPAVEAVAAGADKLGASTEKAKGGVAGMGQSMLQTGRVVQDFTQGGLGGILNNIEGLTMALGLGPGLAGVLTVVGVGFLLLKKPMADFIEAMGGGATGADHQAAAVEKLKEAAEKLKTQLGELAQASDLQVKKLRAENEEMERSVKVTEARAKAQQRAYDEDTKRRQVAAGMEGEPSLEAKTRLPSEKRRADEIKGMVGGDPEASIIKERIGLMIQNRPGANLLSQQARDADRDKVLGDFYAGQADALDMVLKALRPEGGREGEGPLRTGLEQLTPDAQMARRGRNINETLRNFGRKALDKTAEEGRKRAEKAREQRNKDVADAEAQAKEGVEDIQGAEAQEAQRKLQQDIRLGRTVGKEAGKQRNAAGKKALQDIDTTHIPLIPLDTSTEQMGQRLQGMQERMQRGGRGAPTMEQFMAAQQQIQDQVVNNEQAMAQRLAESQRILARARQAGQQINQPMANNGWN